MTHPPGGRVVTLTANPSLDRTLDLPAPLVAGGIVRLGGSATEPGGKGVNVARAIAAAGGDVVSVLPAAASDPIVTALRALGLELATVPVQSPVRTNYTLVDPAGTTTKLNEPGAALSDATRAALSGVLHGHAAAARWVVLSGSLPPSTPVDWYADAGRLAARHRRPGRGGHERGAAARPAGRRSGRRTATCSSPTPRSWPSWPASPRTRSCATRRPPAPRCARCTTAASPRCC